MHRRRRWIHRWPFYDKKLSLMDVFVEMCNIPRRCCDSHWCSMIVWRESFQIGSRQGRDHCHASFWD